jgi:cytochrome c556
MMMKLRVAAVAALGLAAAGIAYAQSPGAAIQQRQDTMKANGGAMRVLTPMARGEQPWNQGAAVQALDTLMKNSDAKVVQLFPRGSGPESGVKTAALPAIWEKMGDFGTALKALNDAAENVLKLARANDEAGFKANFASIGRACGGCHEPFRAKQQ